MTVEEPPEPSRGSSREGPRRSTSPPGALVRPFLGHSISGPTGGDVRSADRSAPLSSGANIRPFMVTSGRTIGATEIAVEAQVAITPHGRTAVDTLNFEYRDIVALCVYPLAVAEIAARLRLHLGVIRVLVGDLKQQGLVTTFEPAVAPSDDVDTIVRVINGLRTRT